MELEVTKAGEVYVPQGAVVAKLVGWDDEETKFGRRLRLWFKDKHDQFAIWVSPKVNERSNLGKILMAMGFKLEPGTKINLQDALAKEVGLIVAKNDRGFARLVDVFKPGETPF